MKFALYLRGERWREVEAPSMVAALNWGHAVLGGDVRNGRLVAVFASRVTPHTDQAAAFSTGEATSCSRRLT